MSVKSAAGSHGSPIVLDFRCVVPCDARTAYALLTEPALMNLWSSARIEGGRGGDVGPGIDAAAPPHACEEDGRGSGGGGGGAGGGADGDGDGGRGGGTGGAAVVAAAGAGGGGGGGAGFGASRVGPHATPGATRCVTLPLLRVRLHEVIRYADPGVAFVYEVLPSATLRSHRGTLLLSPAPGPPGGGTLVEWRVRFETVVYGTGLVVARLLRRDIGASLGVLARVAARPPHLATAAGMRRARMRPPMRAPCESCASGRVCVCVFCVLRSGGGGGGGARAACVRRRGCGG